MEFKYKKLLMVFLCISIVIPQLISPLSKTVFAATSGKCTATSLFIRTGPGTDYDKVLVDTSEAYLTKDQDVTILGEKNGWYQIQATFSGKPVEGYCLGTYIKVGGESVSVTPTETPKVTEAPKATEAPKPTKAPTPTEAPSTSTTVSYKLSIPAKISASELNLRKQASKNGTVVATLKNGTNVTITSGKSNGTEKWYYVSAKVNNKTVKGYVLSDYVTCTFSTGFYATMKANVTLLSKAGTGASNVSVGGTKVTLKKADLVWVSAEETVAGEKWFRVGITYQGKSVRGYVKSSQLILLGKKVTTVTTNPTPTPTPTPDTSGNTSESKNLSLPATVNASGVNLRKDASASSTKLATMDNKTVVTVIGTKNNGSETWYQISVKVNGKTTKGYVLSNYITFTFKTGFYGSISASKIGLQKTPGAGGASVTLSNGKAVSLNKGTNVWLSAEKTVGGEKWFLVGLTLEGKATRGYVRLSNITITGKKATETTKPTPTPTPTPGNTIDDKEDFQIPGTVTANTLNIRESASASSKKLGTLTSNAKVIILNESDVDTETWYRVATEINGKTQIGYVLSIYVKLTLNEVVPAQVGGNSIKPRIDAKSTAAYAKNKDGNIVTLEAGASITIMAEQTADGAKWFKIKSTVNGESIEGFVLASDINFSITSNEVTPTPEPTITPVPTTIPEVSITPEPTSIPQPTITVAPTPTPISEVFSGTGKIKDASSLAVKVDPGYSSSFVGDENGNPILLSAGKEISLHGLAYKDTLKWYHISFDYNGIEYYGYIVEKYVEIDEGSIGEGTPSVPGDGGTNVDFETKLNNEGFPESYKVYLRQLHQMYPNWEFTAYHTGLSWNTVIEKQGVAGKNLITNSKGIGWKSLDTGAYNWKTDSFIVYDGSTWVTASRDAIAYYMDPRNFLTESGIFQYEHLAYKTTYQNLAGVENILKNTPLYQTSYTYIDDYGMTQTISYGQTFMRAAEYSGVSPYHLASRVKQEVVTGTSSLSNSVSGTFTGFEGLYNFYNIGAYHSTVAGGAIANGLKYAKNGTTNATLNTNSLIPWNNRYRSIVGGSYIIGNSYISKGQDTIYLQKFNVTPTSTYSHQYMANVEAPFSESKKVFAAYTDVSSSPIVFSIPVYLNMPATACVAPSNGANPNNWLKTLKVQDSAGNDFGLTPTFDISKDQEYSLIVDSSCEGVNVTATAVSTKAKIRDIGYVSLQYGTNNIVVSVTAENGDIRNYVITIVRSY